MSETTVLTTIGQDKIAAAQSGGDTVNITHVAVVYDLETPYTPTGSKKD